NARGRSGGRERFRFARVNIEPRMRQRKPSPSKFGIKPALLAHLFVRDPAIGGQIEAEQTAHMAMELRLEKISLARGIGRNRFRVQRLIDVLKTIVACRSKMLHDLRIAGLAGNEGG